MSNKKRWQKLAGILAEQYENVEQELEDEKFIIPVKADSKTEVDFSDKLRNLLQQHEIENQDLFDTMRKLLMHAYNNGESSGYADGFKDGWDERGK